ncbi:hypothetical protein BDN72DRAFT_765683 [Pluteus cervinus]|uniref:Uncharacterized protein n=1 Tax=Pluteus cervinus TaxID=181527 RepID=A0ACD3AZ12_9AGAR|nr:hypothetical protein BDN72DRAFT_765683 [Pluteus cervinus]
MPPPSNDPCLNLILLPKNFFVVQLQPDELLSQGILEAITHHTGRFFSITRTNDEISIVGEVWESPGMPEHFQSHSTWKCIKIAGPMEHNLTGIMASFTAPLKEAQVPVFAVSTWNTDYVLVPEDAVSKAVEELKKDGWMFEE